MNFAEYHKSQKLQRLQEFKRLMYWNEGNWSISHNNLQFQEFLTITLFHIHK